MTYAICSVSVAPIRKEAAHRSEMTSQLLFGEAVEIISTDKEWLQVRCIHDGYEGYLTEHLVTEAEQYTAASPAQYVTTGLLNGLEKSGETIPVPMGCSLPGFEAQSKNLWNGFRYAGTYRDTKSGYTIHDLHTILKPWLHAPYLWGGRSFLGVDCSGFVQTAFKILGIQLLRDAWQQAGQGSAVATLQNSRAGDLAFFQNENGRIVHVGFVLEDQRIMHAAGKVRIDTLTEKGIIQPGSGKQTHTFHSLRRIKDFGG